MKSAKLPTQILPRWMLFRAEVQVVVLFALLVLAVTVASLLISPPESQTGTLRSLSKIPPHALALVLAGVAVGAVSFPFSRRIDVGMVLVGVASVILLDLDHLPVILALSQPIRPAHSFVFLGFTFLLLEAVMRRHPELGLMVLSGSLIHMAVDSGVFPLLSPISFDYFSLAGATSTLIALSLVLAAAAGYARRRTLGRQDEHVLFKMGARQARNP